MSYKIGDRILYPMHGAGTIEAIEEQLILGEKHAYYVLRLTSGDMKVMLPIKKLVEIPQVRAGLHHLLANRRIQKPGGCHHRHGLACNGFDLFCTACSIYLVDWYCLQKTIRAMPI